MSFDSALVDALREAASRARARAHAPYSGFCVGAALRSTSGDVYAGCNVENVSYGLSVCAERHALAAAVLDGAEGFSHLLVLTAAQRPTTPCGACRQVLAELASSSLEIRCETLGGATLHTTLGELLPHGFGRDSLES